MDYEMRARLILTSVHMMRESGMALRDVLAAYDRRILKKAWQIVEARKSDVPETDFGNMAGGD